MDRIHIRFKSFYVTTGQDRCRLGKTKEMKVECVWECGVTVSLPNLLRIGEENLCLSRNLEIKILLYQLRFPSSGKKITQISMDAFLDSSFSQWTWSKYRDLSRDTRLASK